MRNDPRWVATRLVLVEVGQGVVIGIEQVSCDIGSIAASENGKVDHRERVLRLETRGKLGSLNCEACQAGIYIHVWIGITNSISASVT